MVLPVFHNAYMKKILKLFLGNVYGKLLCFIKNILLKDPRIMITTIQS